MAALRPDHLGQPHPSRFRGAGVAAEEVLRRHAAAVRAGEPTYRDPRSGLQVFTAAFLASRGWCCESGCRHCPFVGA